MALLALSNSLSAPFSLTNSLSQNQSPIPLADRTLTLELGADATFAAVKAAVEAKQGEFFFNDDDASD